MAITLSLNGKMKHLTEVYFDQYAKLHDFALSSLDMYRNELLSICFSVFVYVYKQLVENDDMERAARLLKYFGKEFETSEPFAMGELRTVGTSKTLLAKNTFIRKFLKRKNIKIVSSYTVELLFMFLNRSDLFIMACAVLNRVKFKIKGQQPSLRQTTKRARTSSKKQKNSKIDMQSQFKCHTLFGATSLKWKCQNEGKNRAKIRSSRDHDGVDIDDGTNGLKFQELSRDALPSSVCFTVLNSHSVGVTDMSVSSDASCVAIATEMSTVQTWDIRSGGNKLYNNQELVSHNQPVYAVDFCPSEVCHDTERINLLSASADRTVSLVMFSLYNERQHKTTKYFSHIIFIFDLLNLGTSLDSKTKFGTCWRWRCREIRKCWSLYGSHEMCLGCFFQSMQATCRILLCHGIERSDSMSLHC